MRWKSKLSIVLWLLQSLRVTNAHHSSVPQVLLVRHTPTRGLFAMKSIHKRHVLAHQELQHTLTEQAVLKRMARDVNDPFVVKLWWSFHDKANLYLVMDFHPGGDLATQLSRWGRLGRDRARFYAAEIVEGVEGLHKAGVIYRDLKPENVLIGSDGHIVLSDFGLSKEFPPKGDHGLDLDGRSTPPGFPIRSQSSNNIKAKPGPHWMNGEQDDSTAGAPPTRSKRGSGGLSRWSDERDVTSTFCGTAEYLAPEVIQGVPYSYEVDWWSFGTMLYEMLTGITPFWADTHADMYVRVLHDELVFPDDRVLDTDTKSILRGLLQRNPILRMKEPRIKKHPYFSMIEWAHVFHKRYIPPYVPPINPLDETDTQNFDETFLDMQPTVTNAVEEDAAEEEVAAKAEEEKAKKAAEERRIAEASATGKQIDADEKSLFDGYSYRGRRDSESVKSTILSTSSDSQISTTVEPDGATDATSPEATPEPSSKITPAAHEAESEDDEEAARAAVAALAHLEREATADLGPLSTDPLPNRRNGTISGEEDEAEKHKSKPAARATRSSRAGMQPQVAVSAGTDDEEEDDWDMIDGTTENLRSELNGGRGQNLFARGVVDTYRLLRRQEPTRQPASPGSKALHRLSRRQPSSNDTRKRTSNVRSPSPGSSSNNDNSGIHSSIGDAATQSKLSTEVEDAAGSLPADESMSKASDMLAPPTTKTKSRGSQRKGTSTGSSDDLHVNSEKAKQPKAKRMKRFTT